MTGYSVIYADPAWRFETFSDKGNGEHGFLYSLVANGTVTLAGLTEAEYEIFYELTSIAPSLDDGEAATIAVASARDFLPVIDERRGRARALAKARAAGWSLDIFRHPSALSTLGDQSAIDALYLALRDGRMRIPPESADTHAVEWRAFLSAQGEQSFLKSWMDGGRYGRFE